MDATEAKLTTVLGEAFVLFVPAWQRRYAWDNTQWIKMWDSLTKVWKSQSREYFLGAIVCQDAGQDGPVRERRRIIDGQQRLVTLSLFVAALQRRAARLGMTELESALTQLLFANEARDQLRVTPWGKDQDPYRACLLDQETPTESAIPRAYEFFSNQIARYTRSQVTGLWEAVRSRLFFAYVRLAESLKVCRVYPRNPRASRRCCATVRQVRQDLNAGRSAPALRA